MSETALFQSSNPVLSEKAFSKIEKDHGIAVMTVKGTLDKIFILFGLMIFAGIFTWKMFLDPQLWPQAFGVLFYAGIASVVVSIVLWFAPKASPFLSPVFAICQGLFLGATTLLTETFMHGVVLQAVALTLGTIVILFFCYRFGLIKVDSKFMAAVIIATAAICAVYLIEMILTLFFHSQIPYIHGSGNFSVIFSLIVVFVASMNLVLDFDFITQQSKMHAPKYMEWYAAYGLLITVIWVYYEILKLLTKLRQRK